MLDFLSPRLKAALAYVNTNTLYELRIRADKPLRANIGGSFVCLGERGVVPDFRLALFPTQREIEDTLFAASGYSVYSVENQIKHGFVTGNAGERIGIAGSYVYQGKEVLAVRSASSLCIRVPHDVTGCAEQIYSACFRPNILSLIVLSPPGQGKTTILRDLTRLVSERTGLNVLVSDERGELSAGDLGGTCDVVRFADKMTAFTEGIRALRPDVIVTDELLESDYPAVLRAIKSGITVFASAHLTSFEDVPQKIFSRYVLLDGLGSVGAILGENGDVA